MMYIQGHKVQVVIELIVTNEHSMIEHTEITDIYFDELPLKVIDQVSQCSQTYCTAGN